MRVGDTGFKGTFHLMDEQSLNSPSSSTDMLVYRFVWIVLKLCRQYCPKFSL